MMRKMSQLRGAVALTLLVTLAGCAPQSSSTGQDVQGTIERSGDSAVGVCHLTVTTVARGPVGETAQIVPQGDRFSWPLPSGDYILSASCSSAMGELEVHVPSEENSHLVILVS